MPTTQAEHRLTIPQLLGSCERWFILIASKHEFWQPARAAAWRRVVELWTPGAARTMDGAHRGTCKASARSLSDTLVDKRLYLATRGMDEALAALQADVATCQSSKTACVANRSAPGPRAVQARSNEAAT